MQIRKKGGMFIPPFFYFELGGHLGWKSGSPDPILEGGHPRAIPPKFGSNWPCGFRGDLAGMVPGWVPFKIVSDSPALHSRWLLLLKIEISSNGQNCSILSQNVSLVAIGPVVSEEKIKM
jgi:hypothetical protein